MIHNVLRLDSSGEATLAFWIRRGRRSTWLRIWGWQRNQRLLYSKRRGRCQRMSIVLDETTNTFALPTAGKPLRAMRLRNVPSIHTPGKSTEPNVSCWLEAFEGSRRIEGVREPRHDARNPGVCAVILRRLLCILESTQPRQIEHASF